MDSLVSQHPAAYSQFAIQVDAHAFPPPSSSASSSASSSSSRSAAHAYPADAYDHRYASSSQRYPAPSSSSSSQYQHQHASPSLQIQTATPAPHEHEPDEQTAHPARLEQQSQQPQYPNAGVDAEMQGQSIADALTDAPGPHGGLSRPLTLQERELLNNLDKLKFFLATAPSRWNSDPSSSTAVPPAPFGMALNNMGAAVGLNAGMNGMGAVNMNGGMALGQLAPAGHPHSTHPALNRFLLPNQEYVSCVLWGGLYHITGTDIVRALVFRFEAFGRPVRNMKKFEEGVFSDLRNLKPGVDACLEEPKVSRSCLGYCLLGCLRCIWGWGFASPRGIRCARPRVQSAWVAMGCIPLLPGTRCARMQSVCIPIVLPAVRSPSDAQMMDSGSRVCTSVPPPWSLHPRAGGSRGPIARE